LPEPPEAASSDKPWRERQTPFVNERGRRSGTVPPLLQQGRWVPVRLGGLPRVPSRGLQPSAHGRGHGHPLGANRRVGYALGPEARRESETFQRADRLQSAGADPSSDPARA
jgi:hypothetical protein